MTALIVRKGSPEVKQCDGVKALSVQQGDIPGCPDWTLVLIGSYSSGDPAKIAPEDWDRVLLIKE